MKLTSEIKYFSPKQNMVFLLSSVSLIWIWMFISSYIDRGNDRGLVTIVGMIAIIALIFDIFLSKNKIVDFFLSALYLLISSLLIFILSLTFGLYLQGLTNINWIGLLIPIVALGALIFINIRRLISFPNNKIAFWCVLSIPILIILGIYSLPFYDDIFISNNGIGFLISIYFTSIFLLIGVLCRTKKIEK